MLQFVPMAEKKSIAPESVIGLTQATEAVFAEHGFATRDMLEEAAEKKAKGLGKLVGANAYGSLGPVFQIRRKAGFTGPAPIRAINDLPVAVTQIEDIDGKEVTVFYLTERTVTQADGTITTVRQKAGEIQDQYIAYQEKRRAAITEREARAQEKRDQATETSRRQEAEKPPSTMNLHFLLYDKGTPQTTIDGLSTQAEGQVEGNVKQLEDLSADELNLLTTITDTKVMLVLLKDGWLPGYLDEFLNLTRAHLVNVADKIDAQARRIAEKILNAMSTLLEGRKGINYQGILPIQRQLALPVAYALMQQKPDELGLTVDEKLLNDRGVETFPVDAVHRLLFNQVPTLTKMEQAERALSNELLIQAIFADALNLMYSPNVNAVGDSRELFVLGIDSVAQQFTTQEIIDLFSVKPFDHEAAERRYIEASKAVTEASKPQNRRRVNMKELLAEQRRAFFLLKNSATVTPDEIPQRIHAALQKKLPQNMPKVEDYQSINGEDPRAFVRARVAYEKQPATFNREPKREDYEGGENAFAFRRDKQLYLIRTKVIDRGLKQQTW